MKIDRIEPRYSYICSLAMWLSIDSWNIYQFYANITSTQDAEIVKNLCNSILANLFNIDIFFGLVCLILSIQIWRHKQTGLYFAFTYLVYTAITTFSLFILGDALIHYERQQRVWEGGTPMLQFIYVALLLVIGCLSVLGYISSQVILWAIKKIRDRR